MLSAECMYAFSGISGVSLLSDYLCVQVAVLFDSIFVSPPPLDRLFTIPHFWCEVGVCGLWV